MRTAGRGLWMLLIVACLAAPARSQTVGNAMPPESLLSQMGLTRAWWGYAVNNVQRDKIVYLTLDESAVYAQSTNGVVTAFDAETGRRLWSSQVGPADQQLYPALAESDLLLCTNGNAIFGVTKTTGEVSWEFPLPGTPAAPPVTDRSPLTKQRRMFLGMLDGSMFAFNLDELINLNAVGRLAEQGHKAVLWRYKTSKAIAAAAISNNRAVSFASKNGTMYTMGIEDKRLFYRFTTQAPLSAAPIRHGDSLVLAAEDFNCYSINMVNGRQLWRFPAGHVISQSPTVIGNDLYLFPDRGGVFLLTADKGRKQWWAPEADAFVSQSIDRVYVRAGPQLTALSRKDGSLAARRPLPAFTKTIANTRNDRIYLCTTNGLLLCLREIGNVFPLPHGNLEDNPLLPSFVSDEEARKLEAAAAAAGDTGAEGDAGTAPAEGAGEAKPAE